MPHDPADTLNALLLAGSLPLTWEEMKENKRRNMAAVDLELKRLRERKEKRDGFGKNDAGNS